MSLTFPEATSVEGRRDAIILTTAPVDPTAVTPTETSTGVNATMYFLGQFAPSGTQNKGNAPSRLGEVFQLPKLGKAVLESPTLSYVHDPQGADEDEINAVRTACAPGSEIWIVQRPGVLVEADVAADQKYRLYHLRTGQSWEVPTGDDEFAIERVMQETEYITAPISGVITAGG